MGSPHETDKTPVWQKGFTPGAGADGQMGRNVGAIVSRTAGRQELGDPVVTSARRQGSYTDFPAVAARAKGDARSKPLIGIVAMSTSGGDADHPGNPAPVAQHGDDERRAVDSGRGSHKSHAETYSPGPSAGGMGGGKDGGSGSLPGFPRDEGHEDDGEGHEDRDASRGNTPRRIVRQPWDGGDQKAVEEVAERAPLVTDIREFGDERPDSEKVEVIAKASGILRFLNVNANLVKEIEEAEEALESLGTQVLARKPEGEEDKDLEGRGIYYHNVTVGKGENKRDIIVYVKGTGSGKNFTSDAVFPGFPPVDGKLFYDDITTHHPRIIGADYISNAILGLITRSIEFAEEAKEKEWTSLSQAIDAKVIIPLPVTHFKEASEYLQGRVEEARNGTNDESIRKNLDWGDNLAVGTVMEIVPSSQRLTKGSLNINDPSHFQNVLDAKNYATVGSAMRDLYNKKVVLPHRNAHAQNVYVGSAAVADSGDHLFLGDCKGFQGYEYGTNRKIDIPPLVHRMGILNGQFSKDAFLVPPYVPSLDPATRLTAGQIIAMQEKFWGRMLKGYARPEAIKLMAETMPLLRTEFLLAASLLLSAESKTDGFAELASKRAALFDQYARFGVAEEYQELVDQSIDPSELLSLTLLISRDRLPMDPIAKFLQTGNITDLVENDRRSEGKNNRVIETMNLTHFILSIPDPDIRDNLLGLAAHYFGKRDLARLVQQPDQIALFESEKAPVRLLTVLIEGGRYSVAETVLNILLASQEEGFRDAYRYDGAPEPSEIYYARELLTSHSVTAGEIREINDKCLFDKKLYDFARIAKPLTAEQTQIIRDNQSEGTIFDPAKHILPTPEQLVRAMLGRYINVTSTKESEEREGISVWLHYYGELQRNLQRRSLKDNDKQTLLDSLDDWVDEKRDIYPELALGHATIMADYYRERDPQRSEQYDQQIIDYYTTIMPARIEELEEQRVLVGPSQEDLKIEYRELAKEYREFGFPVIARIYNRLANGKIKRFAW